MEEGRHAMYDKRVVKPSPVPQPGELWGFGPGEQLFTVLLVLKHKRVFVISSISSHRGRVVHISTFTLDHRHHAWTLVSPERKDLNNI